MPRRQRFFTIMLMLGCSTIAACQKPVEKQKPNPFMVELIPGGPLNPPPAYSVLPPPPTLSHPVTSAHPGPMLKPVPPRLNVGSVERVILTGGQEIEARLDPGVEATFLSADIVRVFTRDNRERVLYKLRQKGEPKLYESVILRWNVRRTGDKEIRRPVIAMRVCLGSEKLQGEAQLIAKADQEYAMLIGHGMLQDKVVLVPDRRFLTQPQCKAAAA